MTSVEQPIEQLPGRARSEAVGLAIAPGPDAVHWRRLLPGADLGQGLVFAVMLVMLLMSEPVSRSAALAAILISALWLVRGRAGAEILPAAVGPVARAAVGAGFGLFLFSIAAAWLSSLETKPSALLVVGGAVVALSIAGENAPRRSRIVLVGGGESSGELFADVGKHRCFEIAAIVGEPGAFRTGSGSARVFDRMADLGAVIEFHRPDFVVVDVKRGRLDVFNALLDVAGSGFRVVGLPEFYEHAFGRVPVAHVTPAWFMSLFHLYQRRYTRLAKRAFDVVVASVSMLIALPLFPLVASLVGRPILYRQVRLGEWGRTFTMYKFRTMRERAEESDRPVFAAVDDPRITKAGQILRRARLDELPQLWNVLVGDMSIVGPRPERPEFSTLLAEQVPHWTRRHMVKPGITGWAQVNSAYAHDAVSTAEKLSYDLWYLRHRSLLIDLMICFRTLRKLVTGSGAR